jgi:hypothetical protein
MTILKALQYTKAMNLRREFGALLSKKIDKAVCKADGSKGRMQHPSIRGCLNRN